MICIYLVSTDGTGHRIGSREEERVGWSCEEMEERRKKETDVDWDRQPSRVTTQKRSSFDWSPARWLTSACGFSSLLAAHRQDHQRPVGTRERDKTDPPSHPSFSGILSSDPVSVAEIKLSGSFFFLRGGLLFLAATYPSNVQACTCELTLYKRTLFTGIHWVGGISSFIWGNLWLMVQLFCLC